MNFFIYDAESLKRKLHLEVNEDISVDDLLKERKVKELLKKIPNKYDINTIKEFEKETGIVLKYWVFTKISFYEYTKLGVHPTSVGKRFNENFLEEFDILVAINEE